MPAPIANSPVAKAYRFAAPRTQTFGVDRNLGLLTGVALITAGVEAKGHGIYIDDKTVSTAAAVLAAKDNRFKAAISHRSWSDWWDGTTDRVMEFPGWFSGVSVKGNQLVAAKLEFYETFKTDQPRLFARILEMAEKTPDLFGISLEPWGYLVYVADDGTEYSERPKDVELKYDGLPALRVTELTYGAIVDDPAANPGGLFAQLSRKLRESDVAAVLRALLAGKQEEPEPAALAAAPAPTAAAASAAKPANTVGSESTTASPTEFSAMKEIIDQINAKFGANPAQFSSAMTILGKNPAITFSALEVEMSKQETADLRTQVTNLTTEKTNLTTQLTAANDKASKAEKERDEWKGKFETLRTTGHVGGEVPTGAPTGGVDLGAENPYLPGKENLTKQCELERKNPALAAQLKAAAQPAAKPAVAATATK